MKLTCCCLIALLALLVAVPLSAQDSSLTIADPDAIPEPMPTLDNNGYTIENFLLLGSDTSNPQNAGRTDVMVIVSVNQSAGTVSMLSIPRDLYVYIPGHRVYRINSAYGYGQQDGVGGYELLAQTITYNLGIHIDHYARVDFSDFKTIVDALGGIDISVDCGIQDWRLKSPDLDPGKADNWAMFTLPIGVHHLDGDLALWYARSRRTSSDFDRGRRHQALLRALWQRILRLKSGGAVVGCLAAGFGDCANGHSTERHAQSGSAGAVARPQPHRILYFPPERRNESLVVARRF